MKTGEPVKQANPLDVAKEQIEIVATHLDIDEGLLEKLKHTKRDVIVHFPVKMEDGTVEVFTGYRVVHNDIRGPAKGGLYQG